MGVKHNSGDQDAQGPAHEARPKERPIVERDNRYWLSLDHYAQDPEFLKKVDEEFGSSPLREDKEEGWARREFMKLMGASLALSTASCIRRPVQKIVPYAQQPEEVTNGVYNSYTTTISDGHETLGVLMRTREGRPLKVEGSPENPLQGGATTARSQAWLMSLYDPERLRGPQKNLFNEKRTNKDTVGVTWESADAAISEQLKKGDIALLTGSTSSPSLKSVIKDFSQGFRANHYVWDPISYEDIQAGQKASYGEEGLPFYRLDKAKMIVSIDADFLGSWLMPATYNHQFLATRNDIKNMSQLVVFDSNYSLTGANADIRVKIKPSQQIDVVMAILNELSKLGADVNGDLKATFADYASVGDEMGVDPELFKMIAKNLWDQRGKAVVLAGGPATQTEWGTSLQVAVNYLNSLLNAEGNTIYSQAMGNLAGGAQQLFALVKACGEGKVKTLIIHEANPFYALPTQAWNDIFKSVEMIITTAPLMNEVAQHAHYVLPMSHAFESWGDSEPVNGLYFLHQPTIRDMYDTRGLGLSLMTWAFMAKVGPERIQKAETYFEYVQAVWRDSIFSSQGKGRSFSQFWDDTLQTGFVGALPSSSGRGFNASALSDVKKIKGRSGLELVLYTTTAMGDGQNTNMSYLWEMPDPVTKIVWDNYASLSVNTAQKMDLHEGSVIDIKWMDQTLQLPVHIQPGLHNDVIAVALGFGRTMGGKIASHQGGNAYTLVKWQDTPVISGSSVEVSVVKGKKIELACTQGHHSMEGRQIVVEATVAEYSKNPGANIHRHKVWNFWPGHAYNGHKWAMAVDLNVCTGCSACVVACQSENNVPVVGKKYVLQGREMHWLRIDRYYTGTPENPETVFQPIMCQHCDNAPCETVCPVLATVHSDEGLNDMTYNRCVGTRYCSNNCPYKVRRFNWFNFRKVDEKPTQMAYNPDVTVRPRGVMEKCTFCVQRIKEGKLKAKLDGRTLKDGDIKTACETACPGNGIVFGDMNDPESRVAKVFKSEPRAYALLEEWHAAPSVRYLSKIRNNGKETMDRDSHSQKGDHS